MKPHYALALCSAVCLSAISCQGATVEMASDGSIAFTRSVSGTGTLKVVLKLGLPAIPAARMWRENGVLRGVWLTNGIQYTETVLLCSPMQDKTGTTATLLPRKPVMLVNLAGQNTNSEYTVATALIEVYFAGVLQELELKNDVIWRLEGNTRMVLGVLDIPESGVKVREGRTLRFEGNIPPALNGSMTLKIPLEALQSELAVENLKDIEFEAALHSATRVTNGLFGPGLQFTY